MAARDLRSITLCARNLYFRLQASAQCRLNRSILKGSNYATWSQRHVFENIQPACFNTLPSRGAEQNCRASTSSSSCWVEFCKIPARNFSESPSLQRSLRSFQQKVVLRKSQNESKESIKEMESNKSSPSFEADVRSSDKGFAGTYRITDTNYARGKDERKARTVVGTTKPQSFSRSSASDRDQTISRKDNEKVEPEAVGKPLDLPHWVEEEVSPPAGAKELLEKRRNELSIVADWSGRDSEMDTEGEPLDLHGLADEEIPPQVSTKRPFEKSRKEMKKRADKTHKSNLSGMDKYVTSEMKKQERHTRKGDHDWSNRSEMEQNWKSEKRRNETMRRDGEKTLSKMDKNVRFEKRKETMRRDEEKMLSKMDKNVRFERRRKDLARKVDQRDRSKMEETVSSDLLDADSEEWKRRKGKKAGTHGQKENRSRKSEEPSTSKGNDLLYGISPCLLALQHQRREIHQVLVTSAFRESSRPAVKEILAILEERCMKVWTTGRGVLDRFSHQRPHQGICMEVSRLYFNTLTVEDQPAAASIRLVLDQIKDPMNLGAVLRSAYFLGVDQIIVSKENCCSLTPVVSKASSGAMEVLPVYATRDIPLYLKEEQAKGWRIVGASQDAGEGRESDVIPCHQYEKTSPVILVIGNEGFGLGREIKGACSEFISIPAGRQMHPGIDSLNVSVATGILLHSLLGRT